MPASPSPIGHATVACLLLSACSEGALHPDSIFEDATETSTDAGRNPTTVVPPVAEPEPRAPVRFECEDLVDDCPMVTGLSYACMSRFALGINYAWRQFGGDFGGAYGRPGVAGDPSGYRDDLTRLQENGVSVVRWWMFPDFRGEGVVFENDDPIGLSTFAVDDIRAALELAEETDTYLVLTPFSFDNFRPDGDNGARLTLGMTPMVKDPDRRAQLVDTVIGGAARAVASSEYAYRLLGWDVINEPEWAVQPTPDAPSGGQFTPTDGLDWVTLDEMKTLINESLAVLREETPHALLSVGWAAAKWEWAFRDIGPIDFHQPHIYAWVNEYWPYTQTPDELGYGDKPTVMGEFFLAEMPLQSSNGRPGSTSASFEEVVSTFWDNGYAGAWAWSLSQSSESLPLIKNVRDARGCRAGF